MKYIVAMLHTTIVKFTSIHIMLSKQITLNFIKLKMKSIKLPTVIIEASTIVSFNISINIIITSFLYCVFIIAHYRRTVY